MDKIIDSEGRAHESYKISTGGIVEITSAEKLVLPEYVTGFAHIKTGLSSQGLLALNIGIIDSGWEGPLSSILVNFGDMNGRLIQRGDVFLRVSFMRHEESAAKSSYKSYTKEEYESKVKKNFSEGFSDSFLSMDGKIERKVKEVTSAGFEKRIAIMGLFLACVLGLIPLLGAYFIYIDPFGLSFKEHVNQNLLDNESSNRDSNKIMMERLRLLEEKIDKIKEKS
ncbi:hypothetical protein [Alcanivorax jadensis]|uniref:hypothetical protein n=1 Tax=Alcanivorax jadensis TaxID=64988 RepID=UPI0035689F22